MRNLLCLLIVFMLLGCSKKDDQPTIEPTILGDSNLKFLWETPFTDGGLAGSEIPQIIGDKVAYAKWVIGANAINEIRYLNTEDGALVSTVEGFSGSGSYTDGVYHYVGRGNKVLQIDPATAEIVQEYEDLTSGYNRVFGIENYVFHITTNATQNHLMAYNTDAGASQLIASVSDVDPYRMDFEWVVPSVAENGDILVYFLQKGYDGVLPYSVAMTLYCYNLTQEELVFEHVFDVLEGAGIGTLEPGQLSNNNLLFYAGKIIFALDKITGELKWEQTFEHRFGGNPILVDDEKLYLLDGNGGTYRFLVLDAETGDFIGDQTGVKGISRKMMRYKESIYFSSAGDGMMYSMDRHTGKMNYRVDAPYKLEDSNRFFLDAFTIDQETGRLYIFDWVSALCFEIVE